MKIKDILAMAIVVAASLSGWSRTADAAEVLYDSSGFVRGQQSFVDSFSVSGPGILTVTLTDMAWPQPLSALDLLMTNAQGALGPEAGPGTESFKVTGGEYFAQWFATAQGPLDVGVYGINISFDSALPVPLPASLSLLLSGLILLWVQRRGTRPASHAEVT